MPAKIHLNLLILFCIFCQEIIGSSLGEKESSADLLVRKKRVINNAPDGTSRAVEIKEYGYVVSIRENGKPHHCAGAILSFRIVITAAKCVVLPVTEYKITAGVTRHTGGHAHLYNITSKSIYIGNNPSRPTDGIFLLTVAPTFEFNKNIRSIGLHRKPVEPGTLVSVPGWGCNTNEHQHSGWEFNKSLQLITVPVISHQNCANAYRQIFTITETDICTHDTSGKQYCGVTDQGAPLVVHTPAGRTELIGINLWGGSLVDKSRPDIYVNVIHPYYLSWIGLHV